MRLLPGPPRVPTCGCRRSPGGARDGPDEQGGVGEPRVARQDRRLLSLRACPRSRDSLNLSCSRRRHKSSAGRPRDPRPSASAPPARSRRGCGGARAQSGEGPEAQGVPGGGGEGGRALRGWGGAHGLRGDQRRGLRWRPRPRAGGAGRCVPVRGIREGGRGR